VEPFNPSKRPVPFRHDADDRRAWSASEYLCGSGQLGGACHYHWPTGKWQLPAYRPLLTDQISGHAHPSCYASSTNDCSVKISLEHPMTAGILRNVGGGKTVEISHLHFQPDGSAPQRLPIKGLGSNILCERHNRALSRLDDTAIRVQASLERYQMAQIYGRDPHGSEFERWLLKVIWGYKASGNAFPANFEAPRERDMLMRYLFRDGLMPKGWGLYVASRSKSFARKFDVAVETLAEVQQETLLSTDITLGAFTFTFVVGVLEAGNGAVAWHRPAGVSMRSDFDSCQKVLAFAWDHARHAQGEYVDIQFRGNR
jgi:hypothetical protein